MKNIIKQTATALLIAITALAGCKKDPDPVVADELENAMTFTTAMEGEAEFSIAGTGTTVIDWGDGTTPDTVTLSGYNGRLTHIFSDTTSRTIIIYGQNITHLSCDWLQLTAFDVSKNTALKYLTCGNNQLTSLDVSKKH